MTELGDLPQRYFGAIYADPPWRFDTWGSQENSKTCVDRHYATMDHHAIAALPVGDLAAADCTLLMWATWPNLLRAIEVINAWGFEYKTCGFLWAKAHANQLELFRDDIDGQIGTGYWTRANSEPCLLATRGKPRRLAADVRQVILEPRREHSRKPDCVYERIERLVAGPYVELFARNRRRGWFAWGNELDKFGGGYDGADDFAKSIDFCYHAVRARQAAGGATWPTENAGRAFGPLWDQLRGNEGAEK